MVTIAETIIERRSGAFEPASFRDRYQDAEPEPKEAAVSKPTRAKPVPDRRPRALLLPVWGGREKKDELVDEPTASAAPKRRKKAG